MLTYDHALPVYKRLYQNYDSFLGVLVKFLDDDSNVIDVGANVGDTLALMLSSNPRLNFYCLEPDEEFFKFLSINKNNFLGRFPKSKIQVSQTLVGNSSDKVKLVGKSGTKKAIKLDNNELEYVTLDQYIQAKSIELNLLKIDVDGYDWDVINSSLVAIQQYKPIIFLECFFENGSQYSGYLKSLETLFSYSYSSVLVFDNYGDLIVEIKNFSQLEKLLKYEIDSNTPNSIKYFDLLFYSDIHNSTVNQAIAEFTS